MIFRFDWILFENYYQLVAINFPNHFVVARSALRCSKFSICPQDRYIWRKDENVRVRDSSMYILCTVNLYIYTMRQAHK